MSDTPRIFTPEQLREWAENKAEVSWLRSQLLAHADALDDLARWQDLATRLAAAASKQDSDLKPGELGAIIDEIEKAKRVA